MRTERVVASEPHLVIEYTMGEKDGVQFPVLSDPCKKAIAAALGILAQSSTPLPPVETVEQQAVAPVAAAEPKAPLTDEMAPPPTEDDLVGQMML